MNGDWPKIVIIYCRILCSLCKTHLALYYCSMLLQMICGSPPKVQQPGSNITGPAIKHTLKLAFCHWSFSWAWLLWQYRQVGLFRIRNVSIKCNYIELFFFRMISEVIFCVISGGTPQIYLDTWIDGSSPQYRFCFTYLYLQPLMNLFFVFVG